MLKIIAKTYSDIEFGSWDPPNLHSYWRMVENIAYQIEG